MIQALTQFTYEFIQTNERTGKKMAMNSLHIESTRHGLFIHLNCVIYANI